LSKRNETKKKTLFRRNFSAKAENRLANSASLRVFIAPESQSFAQTILAEKGLESEPVSKLLDQIQVIKSEFKFLCEQMLIFYPLKIEFK